MSLVAVLLSRHLVQRCTITPYDDSALDGYNQPSGAFGTPVTGVHCRLSDLTDAELATASQDAGILMTDALVVPLATVATVGGRVTSILGRDGGTIEPGPFLIVDVTTRYSDEPEYKRLLLKRVQ